MKIKNLFKEKLKNSNNIITKLVIFISVIFLILGFILNTKLVDVTDNKVIEKEILIDPAEKSFLINMEEERDTRDVEKFEEEYSQILSKLQSEEESKENTLNIGRVNYFLGYNRLLNGDLKYAIKFLEDALVNFEKTTNYFYILNTRLDLMNLYLNTVDYLKALEEANEIYTILQRKDIEGISEEGQKNIEIEVLSGIVITSSNFGMKSVSEKFYNELVELIDNREYEESELAVYAKYKYNMNNGNFEEAKKYASRYVDMSNENDNKKKIPLQLYYIETFFVSKDINESKRLLNEISDELYKTNCKISDAYIYKVEGMYHEIKGEYDVSLKYYLEAIKIFESEELYGYCADINNRIIRLYDKTTIDLEYFVGKGIYYEERYKNTDNLSNLADSLVKIALEKNEEESHKIREAIKNIEKVSNISRGMNIVYALIIASLGIITKRLNDEVKKRKAKEIELQKAIDTDYLTKSYSKQYIYRRLEELKKNNEKFSVCIMDLDNFKKINDTYGHNFGDEVLLKTVTAIKDNIRNYGIIGRFGGEEFILIFKDNFKIEDIPQIIKNSIKNIKWSIEGFNVTVSGGAKEYNNEEIDKLLSKVDALLYKAKAEGKDRILLD